MGPMDKQLAQEALFVACKELEGFEFFLDSGTLLGIYRNGDFIEHDTDVDFGILIDTSKEIKFPKPDWPLVGVWNYRNLPMQRAYLYKGVIVDFYYYYLNFEKDLIVNHNDHGVLKLKYADVIPTKLFEFKNQKIAVPQCPEKVLESEYGKDWKTPKSSKGDWGEDRFNLYKEFPHWPVNLDGHIPNEILMDRLLYCEETIKRFHISSENLSEQLDKVIHQRDLILNSTIWKVSRPLRSLIHFLRG